MKLFIPTIGTVLTLSEDWEFELHAESRNYDLWKLAFTNEKLSGSSAWDDQDFWYKNPRKFLFKKDSILKVDRIYIRKGKADYDSITFSLQHDASGEISKKPRFWVKLTDANTIVCELGDLRKKI